jgi:hypothetical protein
MYDVKSVVSLVDDDGDEVPAPINADADDAAPIAVAFSLTAGAHLDVIREER